MVIALDKKEQFDIFAHPNIHPLLCSHKNNCLWISDLNKKKKKKREKQEPDQRSIKIKSFQHSDTMSK